MTQPTKDLRADLAALIDAAGYLRVRVVPGAKIEKIVIENGTTKIWIRTAPEDGKANKAVISLLAKLLGIPANRIEIVQGHTSRDKRLHIALV